MDFSELKERHESLIREKRELEQEMAYQVQKFQGTLAEAYGLGMIKFNFPCPAYVKRSIINNS